MFIRPFSEEVLHCLTRSLSHPVTVWRRDYVLRLEGFSTSVEIREI